ncbi:MAG TPA: NUDIX domain-containing protein [Candidatus Saccharimonadales bacterium]|nr:NUDIX domain-containing protein [Candidatus Saccharimonadales bacterium]
MTEAYAGAEALESTDNYSLTIVRKNGRILLGRKTRGFGMGRLVAPGGKDEYELAFGMNFWDALRENARSELSQETGLDLVTSSFRWVGNLNLTDSEDETSTVTLFVVDCPPSKETRDEDSREDPELVDLEWFQEDQIPYDRMPDDYRFWLPYILSGERVTAFFRDEGDSLVNGEVYHQKIEPELERMQLVKVVGGAVLQAA